MSIFFKIVGLCWIFSGSVFIFFPGFFVYKLKSKGIKTVRNMLFMAGLCLNSVLLSYGLKDYKLLNKLVFILGIIGLIKTFFFLKRTYLQRTVDFLVGLPKYVLRLMAVSYCFIGYFLFVFK